MLSKDLKCTYDFGAHYFQPDGELMIKQGLPDGVNLIKAPNHHLQQSLKDAVAEGLKKTPKSIPALFFYDTAGSQLFEQICKLLEYYPTRTEQKILTDNVRDIIETVTGEGRTRGTWQWQFFQNTDSY